jgi:hypothetical protein
MSLPLLRDSVLQDLMSRCVVGLAGDGTGYGYYASWLADAAWVAFVIIITAILCVSAADALGLDVEFVVVIALVLGIRDALLVSIAIRAAGSIKDVAGALRQTSTAMQCMAHRVEVRQTLSRGHSRLLPRHPPGDPPSTAA